MKHLYSRVIPVTLRLQMDATVVIRCPSPPEFTSRKFGPLADILTWFVFLGGGLACLSDTHDAKPKKAPIADDEWP